MTEDLGSQACLYRDKAVLVKFSSNETGFHDVSMQKDRKRRKPYYAKFVPEGETQQRFLPQARLPRLRGRRPASWPTTRPRKSSCQLSFPTTRSAGQQRYARCL